MSNQDSYDQSDERRLAVAFEDAKREVFGDMLVPVGLVTCAAARFVAGWLVQTPPAERALLMSEMVDVMFEIIHDNYDADIEVLD